MTATSSTTERSCEKDRENDMRKNDLVIILLHSSKLLLENENDSAIVPAHEDIPKIKKNEQTEWTNALQPEGVLEQTSGEITADHKQ